MDLMFLNGQKYYFVSLDLDYLKKVFKNIRKGHKAEKKVCTGQEQHVVLIHDIQDCCFC